VTTQTAVMIDESWYVRPEDVPVRINAGGVIVRRTDGVTYIALARDQGQTGYILPKGGVDDGESIIEGAKREIEEEAGFTDLKVIMPLGLLERLNFAKTRWLKTHYFLFTTQQVHVEPTEIERHAPPHWFPIDDLPELFWPEQQALVLEYRERIKAIMRDVQK
jgi:8-oxo-dGTP pyrophosphatase MutT (NUDIX family)